MTSRSVSTAPPPAPGLNGGRRTRPEPVPAAAPTPIAPPPKLRRRPALIALGAALVALGGLAAAALATSIGHTHQVLAVRANVDRGSVITAADLTVARVNGDPALRTVPAAERNRLVGKRAAVDLPAGALLTPGSTTSSVVPAAGQALVGVTLSAAQLPARPLLTGDQVRIVDTPRAQDNPPAGEPTGFTATVVDTQRITDSANTVVDVTVPAAQAGQLAAHAATGRVALVLNTRVR